MDEMAKLTDIVSRYRELAAEAEGMASGALMPNKFRDAYRRMAEHWNDLARELELHPPDRALH